MADERTSGHNIPPERSRKLHAEVHAALGAVTRLKNQLYAEGFSQSDPLYQKLEIEQAAMRNLSVELHYMGCKSGVARERPKAPFHPPGGRTD